MPPDPLAPLRTIEAATLAMVRTGDDLTARQLAVLLTCHLQPGDHTVKSLADRLNVTKPAITRALDALGQRGFVRREVQPSDRRVVVARLQKPARVFLTAMQAGAAA